VHVPDAQLAPGMQMFSCMRSNAACTLRRSRPGKTCAQPLDPSDTQVAQVLSTDQVVLLV
jgi:hypothetical protein